MKPVDENKVAELALLASRLDPKQVAEANARMEAELTEKLKSMPKEERLKMLAVQKVLTMRTVEALKNLPNNPEGADPSVALEKLKERPEPKVRVDDQIIEAIRSHDFEQFQRLMIDNRISPFASVRFISDNEGHPLLHWAAHANNHQVVEFLFNKVQPTEHIRLVDQRNVRGETALAWACMVGHSRMIYELVRHGTDIHAACNKGFTAMHVAAQNGHVFTMAQLARRGLHVDVRDNNGHTPLHWAAYKGHVEAAQWLLSHGADPGALDWQNCTPLHWACIRGHLHVVKALIETGASGPYLKAKDNTGGTPQSLAEEKARKIASDLEANPEYEKEPGRNSFTKLQYERVAAYCKERQKIEDAIEANGGKPTLSMRIQAKMPHWSYFLWPVLAPIGYWQYFNVVLPVTSHHLILHFVFNICFWAKWVFWVRLQTKDPGEYVEPYGPPGTTLGRGPSLPSWGWRRGGYPDFSLHNKSVQEEDKRERAQDIDAEAQKLVRSSDVRATRITSNPLMSEWAAKHRALYDRVLDEGLSVPVCLTCEIVKPVRAKHDRVADVCVAKFDHFCPWMNACIGELNYFDFFFTALSATIAMWSWLFLVVYFTWEISPDNSWWTNFKSMWRWELFAWMYSLMAIYGLLMTAQHIHLAARNLSTNEMINGYRYRYLLEDGQRGNPFDRGVLSNIAELLGILKPLRIDPEEYYSVELSGGTREPPMPIKGSPWYRGSHQHGGHSHNAGAHGHHHSHNSGHGHSH